MMEKRMNRRVDLISCLRVIGFFIAIGGAVLSTACHASGAGSASSDVRQFIRAQYIDLDPEVVRDARYAVALVDLNGDGDDEAIVHVFGSRVCGSGGCDTYILERQRGSYRIVTVVGLSSPPIRVLNTTSRGWRDIAVTVQGGGVRRQETILSFGGTAYPENPTVPPARASRPGTVGEVLIAAPPNGEPLFR